jgi:hypothetical protein
MIEPFLPLLFALLLRASVMLCVLCACLVVLRPSPLWVEHDLSQLNVYGEPCLLVLKLCGASVYKRFVFTTFLY